MKRLFLFAVLAVAACSRPSPDAPAAYRPADGAFTAELPGGWRVDETRRGSRLAAFYGPPPSFTQVIAVSFQAKGSAQDYVAAALAGSSGAPRPAPPGGPGLDAVLERALPNNHGGPARENLRVVAVPAPEGFYVLEHAWPSGEAPSPAFEAFLASFRPTEKRAK